MGYTHYWEFKLIHGKANETEALYQRAIKDCARIIRSYSATKGGLWGYTAHTKVGKYGGIEVNGKGADGHETFRLREHFTQNLGSICGYGFCRTAAKPYDVVVTACLVVLKHRLKGAFAVSSDGRREDWAHGTLLA